MAQPRLEIRHPSPQQIRLAWPQTASGFVLEEKVSIGPGAVWVQVQTAPQTIGAEFAVDITAGQRSRFFRLRAAGETPLTTIVRTSPSAGEIGVAVTRETELHLSAPLAANTTVGNHQFYARFGERRILSRIHLASDRRGLTLFYLEPLPSGARIRVTLDATAILDANGRALDADGDGQPGGILNLDFESLSLAPVPQTAVSGRVFASQLRPSAAGTNTFVNVPLGGVTITADGMEETLRTVTDSFGNFTLEPVPAGDFFVHIDGRTVTNLVENVRYPDMAYYPHVGKKWTSIAGENVNLGEIYLPLIPAGTLLPASADAPTVLTFKPDFIAANPQFDGVMITVPPNSLYSDSGLRGGMVGIAPVPPDRLPGPVPEGLPIQDVITIQTDGASNFDVPVPACFPNLPDPVTGEKLEPGAKSALWSFNHDTGRFEVVGSATVTEDGRLVCTDPGVGILAPGWHGTAPGSTASGGATQSGGGSEGDQEPPGCQPPDESDPVYLFSGEFYETAIDMRIKGRGMDFEWKRTYRSKLIGLGPLGYGWKHDYDMQLEASGTGFTLKDGKGRGDRYEARPDGTFQARGFFRQLSRAADGSFSLIHDDRSEWRFLPVNGAPASGRLSAIIDRNGNQMRFEYDAGGLLVRIIDTLDRTITLSYTPERLISSISDFTGRVVRYEYYQEGETAGGAGDLKSVTSPVVTGTPNGNDFPNGQTTSYTYSTGFADERLNHNLLSITYPRQNDRNDPAFGAGPYLRNIYSGTTDPSEADFDRVTRQVWGGGIMDYVYERILPSQANGGAVTRTILNDRVGNVREYFFDEANRMVRERLYTGRANSSEPTSSFANRPQNKLRPDDPDYFETVNEWNQDSRQTRIIHPNGNITEFIYESDVNPNASPRARGNLRMVRRLPGAHAPAGSQAMIEELFEYNSDFANCCGMDFVTRRTDERGNVTRYEYDSRGNVTRLIPPLAEMTEDYRYNQWGQIIEIIRPMNPHGRRRRDTVSYYESGPQRGYQHQVIVDADQLRLATTYEYDPRGNLIREVDARGHDTRYIRNALDDVVREISREVLAGSGTRYATDVAYDANGNVKSVTADNRDEFGNLRENGQLITRYEYEILNSMIRAEAEVDEGRFIVQEFVYDANRNRVLTRSGEAVSGRDPFNAERIDYDERNLLFRTVRGSGGPNQSTTQADYDRNGNLRRISQGIEGIPRITTFIYDGYNRLVSSIDPMGNVRQRDYDAAGNLTSDTFFGELRDNPGGNANVRLSEAHFFYDPANRPTRHEKLLFDPATQSALGSGRATVRREYSGSSQLIREINANGRDTVFGYDTANRMIRIADAAGNSVLSTLDANGNVTAEEHFERSEMDQLVKSFKTQFAFDNLDRLTAAVDSLGNATQFAIDSRGNQVVIRDARGNLTRQRFDGLRRLIERTQVLTDSGDASGNVVGQIRTLSEWDDNWRLVRQTDGNGNATTYSYDPLNRMVGTTFADGTSETISYDQHDNPIVHTKASQTVIRTQYDLLNRISQRQIEPGAGISPATTMERFEYDGRSRITRAVNDQTEVTRAYDSVFSLGSETINGKTTRFAYDEHGNLRQVQYPGGRQVTYEYDAIEQIRSVSDSAGVLAAYQYAGPGRVERRTLRNSTALTYEFDGARRPTRGVYAHGSGAAAVVLDDRRYAWNPVSQKARIEMPALGQAREYQYDSANRLIRSSETSVSSPAAVTTYSLDPAGNRLQVTGPYDPGLYLRSNLLPEPADAQLNQYTTTPFDSRSYDTDGNLERIEKAPGAIQSLAFDYRNRLISAAQADRQITFVYDAFGRRVRKTVAGAQSSTVHYFYSSGWQVVEEQNNTGETLATYVYGRFVDEPLQSERQGGVLFYHQDQNYNVVMLTDSSGQILETCFYGDFGEVGVSRGGEIAGASFFGNPYLFAGARFEPELGWYDMRTRFLDPRAGRFLSRDMIGLWGDAANAGNGYTYAGNDPINMADPLGLLSVRAGQHDFAKGVDLPDVGGNVNNAAWGIPGRIMEQVLKHLNAERELIRQRAIGSVVNQSPALVQNEWARALSQVDAECRLASRTERLLGAGGALVSGSLAGYSEATSRDLNTTTAGTAVRVGGAGVSNAALSLSPHGTIIASASSIIDNVWNLAATELLSAGVVSSAPKPPKVMEVFNNAARGVAAVVDTLATQDSRSMRNFVNDAKNNQGLLSQGLTWIGENIYGELLGSAWNFSSGEYFREIIQEQKRRELLARRAGSSCRK